jgi:hypothetical protein
MLSLLNQGSVFPFKARKAIAFLAADVGSWETASRRWPFPIRCGINADSALVKQSVDSGSEKNQSHSTDPRNLQYRDVRVAAPLKILVPGAPTNISANKDQEPREKRPIGGPGQLD